MEKREKKKVYKEKNDILSLIYPELRIDIFSVDA